MGVTRVDLFAAHAVEEPKHFAMIASIRNATSGDAYRHPGLDLLDLSFVDLSTYLEPAGVGQDKHGGGFHGGFHTSEIEGLRTIIGPHVGPQKIKVGNKISQYDSHQEFTLRNGFSQRFA